MSNPEFTFLPRNLTNSGRSANAKSRTASNRTQLAEVQSDPVASTSTSRDRREEKNYLDDSAYLALFELALSEHALCSNAELLQAMEANEDGFVPISYLTKTSSAFAGLPTVPPETVLIRSLRSSMALEGRLIVSGRSSSEQPGTKWRRYTEIEGGFEVRRKDWSKVRKRIRKYTSFHWENRTVYVENLPSQARTYYAVYEFVKQLLPDSSSAESSTFRIQSISFPPHHKDPPDAPPPTAGKGFVFVVLSHVKDMDYLLERWPWNVEKRHAVSKEESMPKITQEAEEYDFRCLSKRKWEELKEKYLAYQRQLLKNTMAASTPGPSHSKTSQVRGPSVHVSQERAGKPSVPTKLIENAHLDQPPAWFPKNCLVFVKNVHPETNKTTLRTLFASAFNKDASPIDYVDYNKGLDSCYLRLSDSIHSRTLVSYFSEHKIVQANALDNVGVSASGDMSIEVDLAQGKREEVYWEKVPEKIRQAAISKVQEGVGNGASIEKNRDGIEGRKRKRRKRD